MQVPPAGSWPRPHVGSGVERVDPLTFLAECHKRRLNQALSVLCLILGFFWVCFVVCCSLGPLWLCRVILCSVSWLFWLDCQYQCKWLTGKTRLRNDYNVLMGHWIVLTRSEVRVLHLKAFFDTSTTGTPFTCLLAVSEQTGVVFPRVSRQNDAGFCAHVCVYVHAIPRKIVMWMQLLWNSGFARSESRRVAGSTSAADQWRAVFSKVVYCSCEMLSGCQHAGRGRGSVLYVDSSR